MPGKKFYPILLLLLLLLLACRDAGNGPPASPDSVTLTVAVPDATADRYRALVQPFMEQNAGVTVHVESMNRLIGDDPNPARALAQSADLFPASVAFAGNWQSLTLDLTPLANATDFDAGDFPAGLLYAPDGTLRQLPSGIDPLFVLVNKALFDDAGLAYPSMDWTWEEFVALAAQLTQRHGDFTAQYGWVDGLNTNGLLATGLGGPLIDYRITPPTPRLAEDDVAGAVTRYLSLFGDEGVAHTPRSADTAYGEALSLVRDRRAAMWLASTLALGSYSGLDVAALPLPIIAGNDARRLYVRTFGFAASAATQHPETAWQLLEYLSRQPGYDQDAMPARASVRQATGFWNGVNPEVAAVVEAYLDHSFELPYAGAQEAIRQVVAAVLLEEAELSAALAAQESAAQERLRGEAEPLEAMVSDASAAAAVGRILFITQGTHLYRHRALAQAFEEENPHLRVDITGPQWTFFSNTGVRSLDRAYGGRQADCFIHGPLATETEVAKVLPLDGLLELDPNINRDDFYPAVLDAFFRDGFLVGLPDQFSMSLIGYDTTLFDAASLPYPDLGWTLQDFLETAVALTYGEGRHKQYGYVSTQGEFLDFWSFLHAFGVELLDRSVEPPSANFDTPAVADALRWYVALSETYGVKPVYRTNIYDLAGLSRTSEYEADRGAIFAGRRGAMWRSDGSEFEARPAPTAAIEERRYTTFPVAPGADVALPVEVTGLYISAETEQRQACWEWITFLTEHDAGLGLPARQSVAHSEEFRLRAGLAADVMLQNAAQMGQRQLDQPPDWLNLAWWYSVALTRAIEEAVTAEEALAATQAEFDVYRACVVDRELFAVAEKLERLVECAAPASPYVILTGE